MLRLAQCLWNAASLTGISLAIVACSHVAPYITEDENGAPIAIPQQRDGQRVVVDLQGTPSKVIVIKRPAGVSWPKTLVFRVTPGSAGTLDIQAHFRMLIPIQGNASQPVDLTVLSQVYSEPTPQITVRFR
jgi:hypothetical protein